MWPVLQKHSYFLISKKFPLFTLQIEFINYKVGFGGGGCDSGRKELFLNKCGNSDELLRGQGTVARGRDPASRLSGWIVLLICVRDALALGRQSRGAAARLDGQRSLECSRPGSAEGLPGPELLWRSHWEVKSLLPIKQIQYFLNAN